MDTKTLFELTKKLKEGTATPEEKLAILRGIKSVNSEFNLLLKDLIQAVQHTGKKE